MLLILLIFRYVQTCLHVREDLSIMSDQLVKARWFVKQEDKYNNIVFPNGTFSTVPLSVCLTDRPYLSPERSMSKYEARTGICPYWLRNLVAFLQEATSGPKKLSAFSNTAGTPTR